MKTFLFPLNFDYSSKFLGIFEYKLLLPFCIVGFCLATLLSNLNVSFILIINIFITIYLPIFLIANSKVFGEPLIKFLICIIKHFIFSCVYKKYNEKI